MRTVIAHILNNDNSLRLDEQGNPIPKHFTEGHWEQIKKFNDPKFKFVKYQDEIPKGKIVDVEAKIIKPKGNVSEKITKNAGVPVFKMSKELEKQGKSVKIFTENLEGFTVEELKLFLNDDRKTIVKLAKEQIEKLS